MNPLRLSFVAFATLASLNAFAGPTEPYQIELTDADGMRLEDRMLGVAAPVSWDEGDKKLKLSIHDLVCYRNPGETLAHCSHSVNQPKTLFQKIFGKPDPTPAELVAKGFRRVDFVIKEEYAARFMDELLRIGIAPTVDETDGRTYVRAEAIRCASKIERLDDIGEAWNSRKNGECTVDVDPNSKTKFDYSMFAWWKDQTGEAPKNQ
jgi:hypothetical protein